MSAMQAFSDYVGSDVVVDVRSGNLAYLGKLRRVTESTLFLDDADVHDMYESKTSREVYLMESKKYGIKVNRREVAIRVDEVVSISKLDDIVIY